MDDLGSILSGVPHFPDTFWGSQDKVYADKLTVDHIKIRGVNFVYFRKLDVPARTDGDKPLSDKPGLTPFDTKKHSGSGVATLYGEPLIIGSRIDSVVSKITPAWDYSEGFDFRGVLYYPERTDVPDERGHVENRRITLDLARVLCEQVPFSPEIGDIVKLPTLLGEMYDVATVTTDRHRFGGTGFYTAYQLTLTRSSKFEPQRKQVKGVST